MCWTPLPSPARPCSSHGLVNDVLDRSRESAAIGTTPPVRRLGTGSTPDLVVTGETVTALIDGVAVGIGEVLAPTEDDENVRIVNLRVDPAWQRRGIGTRLLVDTARLAHMLGADDREGSPDRYVLGQVDGDGNEHQLEAGEQDRPCRLPTRQCRPSRASAIDRLRPWRVAVPG